MFSGIGNPLYYEPTRNMIYQSDSDADRLIKEFEKYINAGYDPNVVSAQVFSNLNINADDLMPYDIERVQRKVEEIYKSKRY